MASRFDRFTPEERDILDLALGTFYTATKSEASRIMLDDLDVLVDRQMTAASLKAELRTT